MPRRCMAIDTDILMENGSIKKIQDIKPGDRILSFDGNNIVIDTVKNCWKTGVKSVFSLRSATFLPVDVTVDHRVAVKFKNSVGWKKASDLATQNKIYQYAGIPGKISCPLRAELLGLLTHDGYISGYQQPKFTNVNMEILKRVAFLVKEVFGYDVKWRKKGNGFDLGISNGTKGGGYNKNKVKGVFRAVGQDIPKSHKRILPEVFDYDEESILRYLSGVLSADGNLYTQKKDRHFKDKSGKDRHILATSEVSIHCGLSKQLAYDTYWLLRKINIVPQEPKLEKNSNWKIRISQGPQIAKLLSAGPVYGKEDKQSEAILNSKRFSKRRNIESGCYNPASIKKSNTREEYTYDIETKNNHNFFANGYLVHNSGKDITAWSLSIRQCLEKVCIVYYIFPTYSQAKKVIWNSITNDGRQFTDFIPKEAIASKNSQEMKITFTNGSILQLIGSDNIDCYDDKTEILTEDGWKLFKDLAPYERVATLKDGALVYDISNRYVEKHYKGEMYHGHNNAMDFMVTPTHRFYVQSAKGVWKFKTIDNISPTGDKIPATCNNEGGDYKDVLHPLEDKSTLDFLGIDLHLNDFVSLLGIFLTEGCTYKDHKTYRVTITQKKPKNQKIIEKLLTSCGFNYCKCGNNYNIQNKKLYEYFSQFGKQPERFIPKEIKSLPRLYLRHLFYFLILGDGSIQGKQTKFYSSSKRLIDDVQEIAIKLGLSGNVYIKSKKGTKVWFKRDKRFIEYKHDLWQLLVRRSKFKRFASSKKSYISKVQYEGMVYCVSVPSGVIKVRRNGKEMWSGNSIVGTNPYGCVFSEYAIQDPRAYQFISPILRANGGWALFISTPRGKNFFFDMYNMAKQNRNWFAYKLTLDDTKHISQEELQMERDEGLMSEDLIQQEYYTSFTMGVEGAYYAKYIDKMRLAGRISTVPYEIGYKVHTAWDLGVSDSTCILFFQVVGQTIHIIDCYENSKEGLEHYAKVVLNKDYVYGKHIAPFDINVREFGSGMTRLEKAKQLGIKFAVADSISIEDGIESVRSALSKVWIDEKSCIPFIKAIENYRQEWDPKHMVYKPRPLHNWCSHFSDCLRYLCISLPKTRDGLSAEDIEKRYQRAMYGDSNNLPTFFR